MESGGTLRGVSTGATDAREMKAKPFLVEIKPVSVAQCYTDKATKAWHCHERRQ